LFSIKLSCASAQLNLINDPSFEDTLPVVNYYTQWSLKHWKNLDTNKILAAGSVYLSENNPDQTIRLPINQWANQAPRSGNGVIMIDNVFLNIASIRRGMTRSKLKSKLIAGKTYCVKIYAVFGERYASYVTDGLQLYFDNGGLDTMISIHDDSSGIYPQVVPQLSLNHILIDTVNWNLVSGTFIANGSEEYLTIGNFKNDSTTNKILINPFTSNNFGSELLLDDVSVYAVDSKKWLHDTSGTLGDSTVIGLPNYEVPDGQWFSINMVPLGTGSQIKVKNTHANTQYIQAVDVCNSVIYDTMVVYAYPLSNSEFSMLNVELKVWPNPATNIIEISHAVGQQVYLYNAVGTLVATQHITQSKAILQVGHLPKGLYVVKTAGQVCKVVLQ
jgi:hypothetical protein